MDYKKLHKRIDDMLRFEDDHFLVNINLRPEISDKLLQYQFLHVYNIITALRSNRVVLDGSDTGTGKTYTSIAVCKQLNYRPFIICPKTIISTWRRVCELFEVEPIAISNYELIKTGKMYDKDMKKVECPYLTIKDEDDMEDERPDHEKYRWKLPRNTIVIFDEVHKCRNLRSENSQLLLSTQNLFKVLMLSATLSDTPKTFHIFGYMLGFYKSLRQANNWINGMLLEDRNYVGSAPKLSNINIKIYPYKGSRMQISELGGQFPKNQISAECYDLDPDLTKEVNRYFDKIALLEKELAKRPDDEGEILTEIQKARMKIEFYKVPIFAEQAEAYLENGFNVAIFLNFKSAIKELARMLRTDCVMTGDVDMKQREQRVEQFQENKSKVIILTVSLTEGLSLHDKYGVPRVSLISPTFSSIDLKQVLGRICRAGQKTPALQRIMYCSNTCEEAVCHQAKEKFKFTAKLNDDESFI